LFRFGLEMGFEGFLPNALRKNWPEGWQSCRQLGALAPGTLAPHE